MMITAMHKNFQIFSAFKPEFSWEHRRYAFGHQALAALSGLLHRSGLNLEQLLHRGVQSLGQLQSQVG